MLDTNPLLSVTERERESVGHQYDDCIFYGKIPLLCHDGPFQSWDIDDEHQMIDSKALKFIPPVIIVSKKAMTYFILSYCFNVFWLYSFLASSLDVSPHHAKTKAYLILMWFNILLSDLEACLPRQPGNVRWDVQSFILMLNTMFR